MVNRIDGALLSSAAKIVFICSLLIDLGCRCRGRLMWMKTTADHKFRFEGISVRYIYYVRYVQLAIQGVGRCSRCSLTALYLDREQLKIVIEGNYIELCYAELLILIDGFDGIG